MPVGTGISSCQVVVSRIPSLPRVQLMLLGRLLEDSPVRPSDNVRLGVGKNEPKTDFTELLQWVPLTTIIVKTHVDCTVREGGTCYEGCLRTKGGLLVRRSTPSQGVDFHTGTEEVQG